MGCTKIGHRHVWPTEGLLIIQRCEVRCNFCNGEAGRKSWKYAWFLRRHVRAIHVGKKGKGQYPNLIVDDSWDDTKLHHIQLKKTLSGRKPSDIKYVEQPEFEEQRIGGVFHLGASAFMPQDDDEGDIFNGGGREFYGNDDGTYPAFADEEGALNIQNPFEYDDIEGFLFNTVLNQVDFDNPDEEQQQTGFVENGEVDEDGNVVNENAGQDFVPMPESATINPADTIQQKPSGLIKSEPDWDGAPRFFMEDYDFDSGEDEDDADDLDDLPLAQVAHQYNTKPSLEKYGRVLSILDNGAEQMAAEGMQPSDMMPFISMFSRALMSRNEAGDEETA